LRILGLDIGGANIKGAVVISKGARARLKSQFSLPFELFRDKAALADKLAFLRKKIKPEMVALTMTGELCDNFSNRSAGAKWILGCAQKSFAGLAIKVVDNKGELTTMSQARRQPMAVASANWAATARWVAANGLRHGVVIDIGSTTTDILPIKDGAPACRGVDDFSRAREGELVYTGYLRTHAAMVAHEITIQGRKMDSCPEYFAIMGDAHLLSGEMGPREYTCATPDGGPKTKQGAARRLCRIVMADLEQLGMESGKEIADQIVAAQTNRLERALAGIIQRTGLDNSASILAIGAGAGVYGKMIQSRFAMKVLAGLAGVVAKSINPAFCTAMLAHGSAGLHQSSPEPTDWRVYLLSCADGTYYCGATNDIDRRMERHNRGIGSRYTRSRLPVSLVATSRGMTRGEALSLEAMVKKEKRQEKAAVINNY